MKWIASTAFGMEGMTSRDLKHLGMENVHVMESGGAMFEGSFEDAFRANLWLRTCDRVMLVMAQFEAKTYEDLFQGIRAIPWDQYLPEDARFPIRAKCVKSQLMSPSDVQKIAKKAMVERMKQAYGLDWFDEVGVLFQVDISIRDDMVTVCIDASGEPLSKRGYRTWNGEAPIRETLAAALILQSGWHPWQPLYDPCCGTGTLLIEAAFIALGRAPGLTREFAMESWPCVPHEALRSIRSEAKIRYAETSKREIHISGSDIDPEAIDLATRHLKQAGLAGRITLSVKDLRDVTLTEEEGVFVANPPYGERLDNIRAAHAISAQLGKLHERHPGWTLCAFTADMGFEREYGHIAARRRRYYNGRIECEYHIFDPLKQEKAQRQNDFHGRDKSGSRKNTAGPGSAPGRDRFPREKARPSRPGEKKDTRGNKP